MLYIFFKVSMNLRFISEYVDGYEELQCSKIKLLLPVDLTASTASSISDIFDIPVEIIIGFRVFATYFIKGIFTKSADAILKTGTFSLFKKSTLLKSKGVEKINNFLLLAYSKFFFEF